jgi:hypothetical protein
MNLKTICRLDLKVGDIAHFYGARFEITSTEMVADKWCDGHGPVQRANGRWLDGHIQPCYFGPDKDWTFQGNKYSSDTIEVE